MIGDGMGANHLAAANNYTGEVPAYQSWPHTWISTFPAGGSYDGAQAWANFAYVRGSPTDSAAAATALYTGVKSYNAAISVATDGSRLTSIADKARAQGRAVGAVSSVPISHATPGAWIAHNLSRGSGYAIADEGLWGNPNTTGTLLNSIYYTGGLGVTLPPVDVLIGGGHPAWGGGQYVNAAMRDKLAAESSAPGAFTFVERRAGEADGGARLLAASAALTVTRLAALFGGSGGNLEYRLADGSGANAENPTLAEMSQSALAVLSRVPRGFVLMIEGGAIDWAAHISNPNVKKMNLMLGEVLGFNAAIQTVTDWVDDPTNDATWANTLVIVTADHETGYLTAGPDLFPDQPLGEVSAGTLALERIPSNHPYHASWDDSTANGTIDPGETVYWAWNSTGHTNSLVPLYARGAGADLFAGYASGADPVRGAHADNTDVFRAMDAVTVAEDDLPATPQPTIRTDGNAVCLEWPAVTADVTGEATVITHYEVYRAAEPHFSPDAAHKLAEPVAPVYADAPSGPADFYTVRALNVAGGSAASARVGRFAFALQPGE